MARLRSNEWNFSSNAAARISEVLADEKFKDSPLGHAEAELTEYMGNKRLDLVLFRRDMPTKPLITGELKVPWDALGRTPFNSKVVSDAHAKASNCGATYFITWNIRRAVVWRTDDPGVPLLQRVIDDKELIPVVLTKSADLSKPEFQTTWKKAIEEFVGRLHHILIGPPEPTYLPLDRQFIAQLESLLDFPIELTASALHHRMEADARFRRKAEAWMRDRQGWVISTATRMENINRASRFSCYVLVNRLCFYNALLRKYPKLGRLKLHNKINTAELLKAKLTTAFEKAMKYTGDYDTVFEVDTGDEFPFLSEDAVDDWKNLIRSLDDYDFATIDLEIIGAMYEKLISPEERHRYGQHYTQPAVVDLINAFTIASGDADVLDPACGGGTFLVRAYARKKFLNSSQDHTALLASLYGCDVLQYACHLSVINLAIRDLIDDENYPRIHRGDFLEVTADSTFAELPTRLSAGGLITGKRKLQLGSTPLKAIVGNPPYIQSSKIPAELRSAYLTLTRSEWPNFHWDNGSDILVWFFTHSARFLAPDGNLSLLTQSAWLDVEYGIPLQSWMLQNFRIVAIIETEAEPWFSDARVATAVTVLTKEPDETARDDNRVRFVQFRSPLPHSQSSDTEAERQLAVEQLRDAILSHTTDVVESRFRVRMVRQKELHDLGTDGQNKYVGSRWGRYLRAIDSMYNLQQQYKDGFCVLNDLARIARGVTTNCDDFFIVTDISQEALQKHPTAGAFQNAYGTRRAEVANDRVKIVRRDDGVELPLETTYLIPTLKTARDINVRATSRILDASYAVYFTLPRSDLSGMAEAYIAAGEREHWHESTSFNARSDWFVLRDSTIAPILFVKTIQYAPQLLWNDARLLANQRLYNVFSHDDVDPDVLCAVLHSTIFAAERFTGVKALGREAVNDVEVFTARQFKVPDVRQFSVADKRSLRAAFRRLREHEVGPILEHTLAEAGLNEARVYASQHPVSEAVWPQELQDTNRQQIDDIILRSLGVPARSVATTRKRLYNELVAFMRKARLLELEAQINRRGTSSDAPGASELADDLWAEITAADPDAVRTLPADFLPAGGQRQTVVLPIGKVAVVPERDLFTTDKTYALRFGRNTVVEFDSAKHRDLALLLAENRVRGRIAIPKAATACEAMSQAIEEYLTQLLPKLQRNAAEITENVDLQNRIVTEAMKRLVSYDD